MSNKPIGIFDSGVGGTSIWKEIHALMPNEHTIYLADSKNAPYGPKGKEQITALSIKNTELLIKKDCKLIVVACNTATTNAIATLRANYNIPFVGIEPAIKPAALKTQTKAIGILATKGTLSSHLFHTTSDLYSGDIKVIEQDGEGIVQLIENNAIASEEMRVLLESYLAPMLKANIDYLVLGCTHYPFLMPLLLKLLPSHVKIIDASNAVAQRTKYILEHLDLCNTSNNPGQPIFYSNANPDIMSQLLGEKHLVNPLNF